MVVLTAGYVSPFPGYFSVLCGVSPSIDVFEVLVPIKLLPPQGFHQFSPCLSLAVPQISWAALLRKRIVAPWVPNINGPFDTSLFDEQYDENEEFGKPIDTKGMTDAEIFAKVPADWDVEFDSIARAARASRDEAAAAAAAATVPLVTVQINGDSPSSDKESDAFSRVKSPLSVVSKDSANAPSVISAASVTDESAMKRGSKDSTGSATKRTPKSQQDAMSRLSGTKKAGTSPTNLATAVVVSSAPTSFVTSGMSASAVKTVADSATTVSGTTLRKSERRLSANISDTLARLRGAHEGSSSSVLPIVSVDTSIDDDEGELTDVLFSPSVSRFDSPSAANSGATATDTPLAYSSRPPRDGVKALTAETIASTPSMSKQRGGGDDIAAIDALRKVRFPVARPEAPTPQRASHGRGILVDNPTPSEDALFKQESNTPKHGTRTDVLAPSAVSAASDDHDDSRMALARSFVPTPISSGEGSQTAGSIIRVRSGAGMCFAAVVACRLLPL